MLCKVDSATIACAPPSGTWHQRSCCCSTPSSPASGPAAMSTRDRTILRAIYIIRDRQGIMHTTGQPQTIRRCPRTYARPIRARALAQWDLTCSRGASRRRTAITTCPSTHTQPPVPSPSGSTTSSPSSFIAPRRRSSLAFGYSSLALPK